MRLKDAGLFRSLDHGPPNAVFDADEGVEELEFQEHGSGPRGNHSIQFDQGCIERRFDNIGIRFLTRHEFLLLFRS
jgi:hypothetical protein